jgi:methyltransferase-like protein
MARLLGIPAPAPSTARVLELGCSDGGNLIPMAARSLGATFLGIDASKAQIAAGRVVVSALDLSNIELRQQDILNFAPAEGRFDYIIAHGVYSWVPAPVREKILAIVAANLAPNGIAYISYNAMPGSGIRLMLRDLAFFHARGIEDPTGKARRARELITTLAGPMAENDLPHNLLFRQEFGYVERSPELYFRHDLMEEENHAFYFHEFVAAARKHHLQYVSEPSLWEILPTHLGAKARAALGKCEHWLDMEQQMDFLRFRSFRQTLVCHAAVPVRRQITAKAIKEFAFEAHFRGPAEGVDLTPGVPVKFTVDEASHFSTPQPFIKAAMQALSETPGQAIGYAALVEEASRRLLQSARAPGDRGRDEIALMNDLMQAVAAGMIEIHSEPLGPAPVVSDKPRASPLTRYQATNSDRVTNWVHAAIAMDPVPRHVLAACDGSRTIDDIFEVLLTAIADGKLAMADGAQSITDRKRLEEVLRPQIRRIIADCTRLGLMG